MVAEVPRHARSLLPRHSTNMFKFTHQAQIWICLSVCESIRMPFGERVLGVCIILLLLGGSVWTGARARATQIVLELFSFFGHIATAYAAWPCVRPRVCMVRFSVYPPTYSDFATNRNYNNFFSASLSHGNCEYPAFYAGVWLCARIFPSRQIKSTIVSYETTRIGPSINSR